MTEQQTDYITEALGMLGKGYEHPETPEGFISPNYTQSPNDFFDVYLKRIETMAELKVVCAFIRFTFGYHRDAFRMGIDELADYTGLSRNSVVAGAEAAEKRKLLKRINPGENKKAEWGLVVSEIRPSKSEEVAPQSLRGRPSKSEGLSGVKERVKDKDLLDGILHYQLKPKALQDAIRDYFKLTPNWEAKYNRQFMEWAIREEVTPEQIQTAAKLWGSDKRFNWAHPSLKGIQEHWLQLIEDEPQEAVRLL